MMKRNYSLTPKQLGVFYLSIVSFSLLIAICFLIIGVWMILIFTTLELVALTVALYIYTQHALDYEKITIVGKQLLVEKSCGGKAIVEEFNTAGTTLRYSETGGNCLSLKSSKKEVSIGLFVGLNQQEQFVNELRNFLRL